jgi:hypothetical protein
MMNKQLSILLLTVLLFSIPSHAIASNESLVVEQFGDYFDEVVIADSSDRLSNPRDLEFHPGRINELWIANRNSDSITRIQDLIIKHRRTVKIRIVTIFSKKLALFHLEHMTLNLIGNGVLLKRQQIPFVAQG